MITILLTLQLVIPSSSLVRCIGLDACIGPLMTPVVAEPAARVASRPAPKWATALAIAGPLADGLSTYYAMKQSGPAARVTEGNSFYHHLFGANVRPSEILAVKVVQSALFGIGVHQSGKHDREKAIGSALLQAVVHGWVTSRNLRNAATARRLNRIP